MKLIAALGNPGLKYKMTRHNAGFMFADLLAEKYSLYFSLNSKFDAEISKGEICGKEIMLVKPQTYMNLSGQSVRKIMNYYKTDISDLFVVFDDISLNLGVIRFRAKGSDGGHNGVKSIILETGSDKFSRLKFGIGPQPQFMKSESFVLSCFEKENLILLQKSLENSVEAFEYYLMNGICHAQNKYN